jgi:hypothetical protein
MSLPGEWTVVRHVVRMCGRVVDEKGRPVAGADVTLWSAPEPAGGKRPSAARQQGPADVCALLDQTSSRPDGFYFFLDCHPGRFFVRALAAGARTCTVKGARAAVEGAQADGAPVAVADIAVARLPGRPGRQANPG